MRGKLYMVLTKICGGLGWLGQKIKFWAEFKEWNYWHETQCKIIDMPNDLKVFLHYNRIGESLRINVEHCPVVDGRYGKFTTLSKIELSDQDVLQILKVGEAEDE